MIDVERVPGELLLLGGTQLCMGFSFTVATVAEFSQSMVRNPGGSGALITIEQAAIFSSAAQITILGPTTNTYSVAGVQTVRDTRRGPAGIPVGRVLSDSLLVAGADFFRAQINGIDSLILKDRNSLAVLAPGTAFSISAGAANTNLTVAWLWRERPAEVSELSL
jgi:hypothetical protein